MLCGNGMLDADEACDDGNAVWSDGCEPDCTSTHIARVHAGLNTCVIFGSGRLRCWGLNADGELGQGHKNHLGDNELAADIPDIELGDVKVESVATSTHTCVVLVGGALRCWGANNFGQLGYEHTETIGDDEPASVAKDINVGGPVTQVVVGARSTCALLASGGVRCWGANSYGQLGYATTDIIGDNPGDMPPPDVQLGGPAIQIAANWESVCALLEDGAVRCWGFGQLYGVLGTGTLELLGDDEHPVSRPPVQLGGPAVQLSAGSASNCALMASGAVRCWGSYGEGQLGNEQGSKHVGDEPGEMPPVDSNVGGEVVDIRCDGSVFSTTRCFTLAGGVVRCFGAGHSGGLGSESTTPIGWKPGEMPPPDVDLGGPLVQLACGGNHNCALLADDKLRCWGYNEHGQLGQGHILNVGDEPGEMPPPDIAVF